MSFISFNPDKPVVAPTKDKEDDVGVSTDTGFIQFPTMPEAPKPEKPYFDDEALEGGLILPFTPQWRLLEATSTKASSAVGKVIKSIMDMSRNKGIPAQTVDTIKMGTKEELEDIANTIKNTGGMDLGGELGDELLGIPGMTPKKGNFFEQSRYFNTAVPRMESKIRKQVKETFPGSPQLVDDVVGAVQRTYKQVDDRVQAAYDKVEELGDDTFKYDAGEMRNTILEELTNKGIPEPAVRNIKRNLFYRERNLSPAQKAAQRALPTADEEFQDAALDLTLMVPKAADGRRNALKEAEKLRDIISITPRAQRKVQLRDLDNAIKRYKGSQTKVDELEGTLPDLDTIGEKEFIRLIREINRKQNVGGNDISRFDSEEQKGLRIAKRMVEDYFEKATSETNPSISQTFKDARGEAAEKFKMFGRGNRGNEYFPELGKLVKKNFVEGQEIDNTSQVASILKNTPKIRKIGRILEGTDPGITKKMAEEWLDEKLGTVLQGDRGLVDLKRVDTQSLRTKLDNIVSDDRAMSFITDILGPQKAKDIETLHNMVSSVNTMIKEIGREGAERVAKTPGEYIAEGSGITGTLGRSLKLIYDYFSDTGTAGQYGSKVLERITELVDRVQKSKGYTEKSFAATALENFVKGLEKTAPIAAQQIDNPNQPVPGIGADDFNQLIQRITNGNK